MMGYYEAKFMREAQANPIDWVITPAGHNRYKLVYIGPPPGELGWNPTTNDLLAEDWRLAK